MPYRVNPKTGVIECDDPREAVELSTLVMGSRAQESEPEGPREGTKQVKPDVRGFVNRLKPDSRDFLQYAMEHPGFSIQDFKELLRLKNGKGIGGYLASITRQAKNFDMPTVITKNERTGRYRVTEKFGDLFLFAGIQWKDYPVAAQGKETGNTDEGSGLPTLSNPDQ